MVRRKKVEIVEDNSPQFKLKMKTKDRKSKSRSTVGAAWMNSAGGINIKLDPGVVISWRDMEDYMLTLWPVDDEFDGDQA